jgi:hypothetical protein
MIDLPFSFLKRKVQASEQVPNAFCCSTTRGFATQFSATMNYMMMLPGPFYQGYRAESGAPLLLRWLCWSLEVWRSWVILQRSTRLM